MSQFWSNKVHKLTPYIPGEQPVISHLIKLNTNENPYPPSPKVIDAIQAAANADLRKYPDPNGQVLKQTIADYYQLNSQQVFIGNSSDEVLGHTFHALLKHDKPLLSPDISYSFYPVYCRLYGIDYKQIPLTRDFSINIDDYNIDNGGIIFANPNAPTGIALKLEKIEALLQKHPRSVIVVDEAYADFAEQSAISLIEKYDNLLVIQTLSKSRSLAGLRVGFACGHDDLITGLERVKNSFHPYALDSLALAGATAAFNDDAYFKQCTAKIINTREHSRRQLLQMGFEVLASQTNFLFVQHATFAASDLFMALRENKILVRHFKQARIDNFLRISIGNDQEMAELLTTLDAIINA